MSDLLVLDVSDNDRKCCGFFKSEDGFDESIGTKYRRPVILLSMFSLIYIFAGIKIKGSSVGIISGEITNPSVIEYVLIVSLIYSLIVYLSAFWIQHEHYYLTISDNIGKYHNSMVIYFIENIVKTYLVNSKIYVSRVEFHNFDRRGNEQKLEIHGVNDNISNEVDGLMTKIGATKIKDNNIGSKFVYMIPYKLSTDDVEYYKKHFKKLKLLHFKNFVEYRFPYMLGIFTLWSYLITKIHY